MTPALQLGPVALPTSVLLLLAASGLGLAVGGWRARRIGIDVESQLLRLLAVALVAARLGFVWPHRSAYLDSPLSMLDIRDGGWNAQLGLIAAWLAALVIVRRQRALRWPVLAAMGSGSMLWIAGTLVLLLFGPKADRLPDLDLSDLDGRPTVLATFSGQPVVLNLWATWCAPCRREMPVLAQAQAAHPGVHVVFLNQGETSETVQRYLARSGLELRNVLLDRKGLAAAPYGGMLPTTVFFDAQGRLVSVRTGELSAASLGQRLRELRPSPAD